MNNLIDKEKKPNELWKMAELAHEKVNEEYTQEAISKELKPLLQ